MRRKIIGILFSFLLLILFIEAALALVDPLGMTYYNDLAYVWYRLIDDPRGYGLPPGQYQLRDWSFTILDDHTRRIPDHQNGDTQVIFIGDSVTFGYGVNDEQTWVNLLAAAFPDMHMVNAAMPGYNSSNAKRSLALFPDANLILYLVIPNDAWASWREGGVDPSTQLPRESYLRLYLTRLPEVLRSGSRDEIAQAEMLAGNMTRFYNDLDDITADERLLLVCFDDAFGHLVAERYQATLLDWYTDSVSPADSHPGVEGNRQIADQMMPILREILAR